MLRLMGVICVWLLAFPGFGQSRPKYQVGTIAAVRPHQAAGEKTSDAISYDVSVRVGNTIYLVLYTPPLGAIPVKYAAGRNLLVQIDERTLRYSNILGESLEVPIISRKPATDAKPSE